MIEARRIAQIGIFLLGLVYLESLLRTLGWLVELWTGDEPSRVADGREGRRLAGAAGLLHRREALGHGESDRQGIGKPRPATDAALRVLGGRVLIAGEQPPVIAAKLLLGFG